MSDQHVVPNGEHEHQVTFHEDVFIPDHTPRKETSTFVKAKKELKASGEYRCAICGDDATIEAHHFFIEKAFELSVQWQQLKDFMTGKTTDFYSHKLNKFVPIPKMHPWHLLKYASQGFDWENFDITKPETFVDSKYNMLPLCSHHHRGSDHSIHELTFPSFIIQSMLKEGFIFSPDEIKV